jgi:hypothetical protein
MHFLASAFALPPIALPPIALPCLCLAMTVSPPFRVAIDSPWWENYERRDRFRCDQQQVLVLERNESQASILMGGHRSTLFRDRQADNSVRYSGEGLMLRLNGDELQLELTRPMPILIQCQRTEDV